MSTGILNTGLITQDLAKKSFAAHDYAPDAEWRSAAVWSYFDA
jgi:hypothetical protein